MRVTQEDVGTTLHCSSIPYGTKGLYPIQPSLHCSTLSPGGIQAQGHLGTLSTGVLLL